MHANNLHMALKYDITNLIKIIPCLIKLFSAIKSFHIQMICSQHLLKDQTKINFPV
jgi:hypothetical protein